MLGKNIYYGRFPSSLHNKNGCFPPAFIINYSSTTSAFAAFFVIDAIPFLQAARDL